MRDATKGRLEIVDPDAVAQGFSLDKALEVFEE
jgi:hypothetical protein